MGCDLLGRGGQLVLGNPRTSLLWNQAEIGPLLDRLNPAGMDMRAYGLRRPGGLPIEKPSIIACSSRGLANFLARRSRCSGPSPRRADLFGPPVAPRLPVK
eukprot:580918-Alexandrium_andersonii.AAC.1